ncbi:hypothetical protein BKA61DRAFT_674158 [Leptodontidium sp. MPI-SDFR-AT-0119]|nr:hypothetical protein BKA61DRAFT_674158 [Leptodontidium sp. MPI-SDFR-AT-0119]
MSARQLTFTYPRDNRCTLPDLTQFPSVSNGTVNTVAHSSEVEKIWKASYVLGFGADAHLRELRNGNDEFPVCKVAINARQRRLLQDEFLLLRVLSAHDLPVVRTYTEPLVDEEGIFGYRMEKLVDIDMDNAAEYVPDIEQAVAAIHLLGIALYDITPSNVMLNTQGRITMIDFGRAGYIGEEIPLCKVMGINPTTKIYSTYLDRLALDQTIERLTSNARASG